MRFIESLRSVFYFFLIPSEEKEDNKSAVMHVYFMCQIYKDEWC